MTNKYAPIIEMLGGGHSKGLDEIQINSIETQLGYALPADYREFLRGYNGTSCQDGIFPVFRDNRWIDNRICVLFGSDEEDTIADDYFRLLGDYESPVDIDEPNDFEWYPGIHLVRDVAVPARDMSWPEELLPIGIDQGNNFICMALFGLRPNAIFWWKSNPVEGCQNLYLVANSFDEFMHLLRVGE